MYSLIKKKNTVYMDKKFNLNLNLEIWYDVCPPKDAAVEDVVDMQSPSNCPRVSPWKTPCTTKVNDSITGGTFVRWEEKTLPWWVRIKKIDCNRLTVKEIY